MSQTHGPRGTGSTPDIPEGLIAGHLLRLIRAQTGLTREQLAEQLGVDVNTVKSWETGRRPLAHTRVHVLRALVRLLRQRGADPHLLAQLDTAIDVDLAVADILHRGARTDGHPLATWVSTRSWSALLAWAITGTVPPGFNGGATLLLPRPRMAVAVREDLFAALRAAAEQAPSGDPAAVLLRRQVYFLTALDRSGPGQDWLTRMERRETRTLRAGAGWTPDWAVGRSLAVARAAQGEPDQLRHFITTHLADDRQEAANLNYWAYWIGEYATPATGDHFMATTDLTGWRGNALLEHLVAGMDPATPYVELTIHTVWALLRRRPWLMDDDPAVTADLHHRTTILLDSRQHLSGQARRELDQLHFATATRGRS